RRRRPRHARADPRVPRSLRPDVPRRDRRRARARAVARDVRRRGREARARPGQLYRRAQPARVLRRTERRMDRGIERAARSREDRHRFPESSSPARRALMSVPAQVWLQHLLPQRLLCRIVHRASRSRAPWLRRRLIRWFARTYEVDLAEAEHESLDAYPTFNAFFTRALKPGARPLDGGERTVVSPADGVLTEFGRVTEGLLVQAKGIRYELRALLGEPDDAIEPYLGGEFLTIYLAPHNYHRVHAPLRGELVQTRYLPGRRFGVNAATA